MKILHSNFVIIHHIYILKFISYDYDYRMMQRTTVKMDMKKIINHRKTLNQWHVFIGSKTKVLFAFFFPCLPFTRSIVLVKNINVAQTQFWVLLCMFWACTWATLFESCNARFAFVPGQHFWVLLCRFLGFAMDEVYIHYKPKLCITGPECVSGKHQIHVAWTNEQSGKKEARVLLYCLS
jgi:hypothetical protein